MKYLQFNPEAPASGYWDQAIIEECFNEDQVFVIPGGSQADFIPQLNERLATEPYCVVIISSDEMGYFPWQRLSHPFMKVYLQYNSGADRMIPIGAPPNGPKVGSKKSIDILYAGQVNTRDRRLCVQAVDKLGGSLYLSDGFAKGLPKDRYNHLMNAAKIVPCPGGHVSPDSFRLYEALEAGATPVVNNREYFKMLLGNFPFPCVYEWSELKDITYADYSEWWYQYKQQLNKNLKDDLWTLRSSYQAAR